MYGLPRVHNFSQHQYWAGQRLHPAHLWFCYACWPPGGVSREQRSVSSAGRFVVMMPSSAFPQVSQSLQHAFSCPDAFAFTCLYCPLPSALLPALGAVLLTYFHSRHPRTTPPNSLSLPQMPYDSLSSPTLFHRFIYRSSPYLILFQML